MAQCALTFWKKENKFVLLVISDCDSDAPLTVRIASPRELTCCVSSENEDKGCSRL